MTTDAMSTEPIEARRVALEQKARDLLESAAVVVGDGEIYRDCERLVQDYHATLRRLASQQTVNSLTIAFVGPLNAGKTFLARMLVRQEAALEKLPSGEGTAERTQLLTWIGPDRPPTLDPKIERHVAVPAESLEDLGPRYLLIDTPGSGDRDRGLTELARRALTTAKLKVLVLPSHQRRAESWQHYLQEGDGSLVLPVIRLSAGESKDPEASAPGILQEWQTHLSQAQKAMPRLTLLQPMALPDIEVSNDPREAENRLRERLVRALRAAVNSPEMAGLSPIPQMLASEERFEAELRALLEPSLEKLTGPHQKLREATKRLPIAAVDYLLRDGRRLRALLRSELRQDLMERMSPLAFPFRPLTGMLCFTTGAWDRLILAGTGSLPSMLMTGVSAVRNIREQNEAAKTLRDELKEGLETLVRNTVGPAFSQFQASVEHFANAKVVHESIEYEVHGADAFREVWQTEKELVIQKNRTGSLAAGFLALLGMAAFWFLLGAPLLHLYGQYVAAAWQSWQGDWSSTALTVYPALGAGFWLTALLLALAPSFVLALILVAGALSNRRVRRCENRLREEMQRLMEQGEIPFSIEITAPLLKAADRLMQLRAD